MEKLNKKGWGLQAELMFICMFLICFIIAGVGLKKLGLLDNKYNIFSPNFTTDNYNVNKSDYYELENSLVKAAKKYVNLNVNTEITEITKTISANFLRDKGYLKKFQIGKAYCTGYVDIKKSNDILLYSPYIKCPNYETTDYNEGKDW